MVPQQPPSSHAPPFAKVALTGGEFLRAGRKHRASGLDAGKTRVRLAHQRQICYLCNTGQEGEHFAPAEAAVQAQRRDAQTVQQHRHGLHRAAGEQLALRIGGHGGENGQVAGLMRAQYGGLHFIGVADGFNDDAVGPGLRPQPCGLAVRGNGLLEGQFAIGSQQLARGTHVKGHPAVTGLLRGFLLPAARPHG